MDHLHRAGVVRARDLPGSARTLSRLAARGLVVRMLPGIYALAGLADNFRAKCMAIMLWDPDAVIAGRAAAKLDYWPDARVEVVEFHSTRKKTAPRGFRLHRSRVPDADIVERVGLRITRTARTTLDLARHDNGEAIDEAFRQTRLQPGDLVKALGRSARRWGNKVRRFVVRNSRARPWSQGERRLHKTFWDHGLTGWVTNYKTYASGRRRYLDLVFLSERLVVEFDGFKFHDREQFEGDRERRNALVRDGWTVLQVTWQMLADPAAVVALVREVLTRLRRRRPRRRQVPQTMLR
ncbi:DUF559 domain-containing protein [Propionibacteriaceae bacterium G1746]|uniref:DUF559 domain-containing protein n=1 Tax=Aestuariimicrobium sp. G57 TaxID=3418485 RepID=UPI003C1F9C58